MLENEKVEINSYCSSDGLPRDCPALYSGKATIAKNALPCQFRIQFTIKCIIFSLGAIQVLRNAVGGGVCLLSRKKALRKYKVQIY